MCFPFYFPFTKCRWRGFGGELSFELFSLRSNSDNNRHQHPISLVCEQSTTQSPYWFMLNFLWLLAQTLCKRRIFYSTSLFFYWISGSEIKTRRILFTFFFIRNRRNINCSLKTFLSTEFFCQKQQRKEYFCVNGWNFPFFLFILLKYF